MGSQWRPPRAVLSTHTGGTAAPARGNRTLGGIRQGRVASASWTRVLMPSARDQRRFGRHLRSLFWWRRASDEVLEEMRLHADLRARELEAEGMPPDAARLRALRE